MSIRSVIVGTGASAALLARQIEAVEERPDVVGAVLIEDGAPTELGATPVLASIENLVSVCAKVRAEQAIVSLPAHERHRWRSISAELRHAGIVERFVTPMDELLASAPPAPASVGVERGNGRIDLARLVGRRPHQIDRVLGANELRDRCVLVTGAGG